MKLQGFCRRFWLIAVVLSGVMVGGVSGARAATMRIDNMPLGKVIAINGQKFAKVRNDFTKGSQFVAMQNLSVCTLGATATMQTWNDCGALATPTGTNFTQGPCLTDSRDGKVYEIRKFADGKCWMADNLAYGGVPDNCTGADAIAYTSAAYGGADGMASYSNRFGVNTYGNCRDPRVGAATFSPCYNSTICGYLYNWQAAMQQPSAYYNTTYTGPTTNVQGLCPSGWHLPTGGDTGEFAVLDIANGGTGAYTTTVDAVSNFWRPNYAYKGVRVTGVGSDGSLYVQGTTLYHWSASEYVAGSARYLHVNSFGAHPGTTHTSKNNGVPIRCIKN